MIFLQFAIVLVFGMLLGFYWAMMTGILVYRQRKHATFHMCYFWPLVRAAWRGSTWICTGSSAPMDFSTMTRHYRRVTVDELLPLAFDEVRPRAQSARSNA